MQRAWPGEERRGYTTPELISRINSPLKLLAAKANDSHLQAALICTKLTYWQTPLFLSPAALWARDLHFVQQIHAIIKGFAFKTVKGALINFILGSQKCAN